MPYRLLIVLVAFLAFIAAFIYSATANAQQGAYFRHVGPGAVASAPVSPNPNPGGGGTTPTNPNPEEPEEPTDPETPTAPTTATLNAPGGWTWLVSNWSRVPAWRYAFINSQGPAVVLNMVWDTAACGRAGYGWTDSGNIHLDPGTCSSGAAMAALESELGLSMPVVTPMQYGERPNRPTFFDADGNALANPPPM